MSEPDDGRNDERTYWRSIRRRREEIVSVREEMTRERGTLATAIDRTGNLLSKPAFFAGLLGAHLGWVILNAGILPLGPWDPYPFMFLATVASAEAPFFALLILMRQQRDQRIAELREEVDLQVALHGERENTRLLRIIHGIATAIGVPVEEDEELERMTEELDPKHLLSELQERIEEEEEIPGETNG